MHPDGATYTPSTRRMLVVDDLPEICTFFAALARRARTVPVALTTEVNAARAVELVRSERFDLVVSDFRMRGADGADVLAAARASNPAGVRVLMTGYNEIPTEVARLKAAQIDAYIQKPLRAQDLLVLVLDLLNGTESTLAACRRQARELESAAANEARYAQVDGRPAEG